MIIICAFQNLEITDYICKKTIVSAASNSDLTISSFSVKCILSLAANLSGSDGFIVLQKSLLSKNFFKKV